MQNPGQTDGVAAPVQQTDTPPVAKRAPRAAIKTRQVLSPLPPAKTPVTPASDVAIRTAAPVTVTTPVTVDSEKRLKEKKPKLVRESFNLPMLDYLMLETLKLRGGKLGSPVKKSVLIRAGILAMAAMSDANFLMLLKSVPATKTSTPTNN